MDIQTPILLAVVGGVIALGVYRKSEDEQKLKRGTDDTDLLLQQQKNQLDKRNILNTNREQVARVLHLIESKLKPGDSIIQVYDYSADSVADGIEYTFDVMLFNSASTQAKTKRLICTQDGLILHQYDISPITGEIIKFKQHEDYISDIIESEERPDTGVKFVRDKYAFVNRAYELPDEPQLPSNPTQTEMAIYEKTKIVYHDQVKELRSKDQFNRRDIAFVETTRDNTEPAFPYDTPRSYGFSAVQDTPIDYGQLSYTKPLKDEAFFNAIAAEKSAFNLQYN